VSRPGSFHTAIAAIMQAEAEAIATDLRTKVGTLVATDAGVAANLTAATAGMGTTAFAEPDRPSAPQSRKAADHGQPKVQLVDHKTAPPTDPTPNPGAEGSSSPAATLGLPTYNPASLPNDEARRVYAEGKLRIIQQDEQLAKQGVSLEERAKIASANRNALRTWIRDIMADREGAEALDRSDPNMTWDQVVNKYKSAGLSGDQLYSKVIEKSVGSRAAVDAQFGVDPKNPGALPSLRPSAPTAPSAPRPPPAELPKGLPRLGGILPDDAMPHIVDLPGELAGESEVPILGDGLPDHRN
jgi:hypothetical protein